MKLSLLRFPVLVVSMLTLASCSVIEPPLSYPSGRTSTPSSRLPEVIPPKDGQPVQTETIEVEQAKNPYDEVPQSSSSPVVFTNMPAATTSVSSPAVKALLTQARVDMAASRYTAATGKLERALRIEPRNPLVWHQLAKAHYNEGKDASAISMAKKSNFYTAENSSLEKQNWQLIKSASKRSGDIKTLKDAIRYERNHP